MTYVIHALPALLVLAMLATVLVCLKVRRQADRDSRERERALSLQRKAFGAITSQLLSGVEVRPYCKHVAEVISQATTFRRVAVLLASKDGRFSIAGAANVPPEVLEALSAPVGKLTAESVIEMCSLGWRVGEDSYRCPHNVSLSLGSVHAGPQHEKAAPAWGAGDQLIVPLRSPRNTSAGCILLSQPRDLTRVTADEMYWLERLADDLAIALENARLQRELVMTEKLAGLGRLVAGVAHELNNPLTAVLGYSEMLADRLPDDATRREVNVIYREAERMKRTIQNLLFFAQQAHTGQHQIALGPVLEQVLSLRAYEGRNRGIRITADVPPGLPQVTIDQDELKQVFLNVLNNALDAVASSPEPQIAIEARRQDGHVALCFKDNGEGFSNPGRVFDPFFTTKQVGKGSGLGLSICYGILKQHGGDISAHNLHPRGGCVTIELPVAQAEQSSPEKEIKTALSS